MAKAENKKLFADQFDDEEVLYVFKKHPIVMRKSLIIAMVGPLIGVLPAAIMPTLGFGWFFGGIGTGFLLSFIVMLPAWVGWYYSVYIVTDQRLLQITQKGFFHKSVVDLGLNKIQSVNYEIAGFQETVLGFGTILVQTYMGDLVIHDVGHPVQINKKLNEILRSQDIVADSLHPEETKEQ